MRSALTAGRMLFERNRDLMASARAHHMQG